MVSIVRLIRRVFAWTSFVFGTALNSVLIFLIVKHTPKTMQVYSKILLQTCVNDLALLFVSITFDGYMFGSNGGIEIWNDGWLNQLSVSSPWAHWGDWFLFLLWCFLVYFSLFGVVAQFIYRYMTLNRFKTISIQRYFAMLAGIGLIPLVYCAVLGYSYYLPPPEHLFLGDQAVADFLDLNITGQNVMLSAYYNGGDLMMFGFWYILMAMTVAYSIMIVLGWRMVAFVRANLKGATNKQAEILQRQKQITLTLIIQALLPTFVYASLVFMLVSLVFKVTYRGDAAIAFQYYNFLTDIPMVLPSPLNPVVTILVIKDYRRAFRHLFLYRSVATKEPVVEIPIQPIFTIKSQHQKRVINARVQGYNHKV